MSETVWELTINKLIEQGVEAFPPATKLGECRAPYVVIKEDGGAQIGDFSSTAQYISVMVYVPKDKYSTLAHEKNRVIEAMEELYPMLLSTGEETPAFYDDTVKAHMVSIMYRYSQKSKH